MKQSFSIPLPTVSINKFYYNDKRHGIRTEARDWQHKFFHFLSLGDNATKLEALRSTFDSKVHGYVVDFTFFVPKQVFVNKAGTLSSKAIDLTNCEKSIIDVLFLPKHFDVESPYGCRNLNVDDKYLVEMRSRKKVSAYDYAYMDVVIELVDLSERCGL